MWIYFRQRTGVGVKIRVQARGHAGRVGLRVSTSTRVVDFGKSLYARFDSSSKYCPGSRRLFSAAGFVAFSVVCPFVVVASSGPVGLAVAKGAVRPLPHGLVVLVGHQPAACPGDPCGSRRTCRSCTSRWGWRSPSSVGSQMYSVLPLPMRTAVVVFAQQSPLRNFAVAIDERRADAGSWSRRLG